MQLQEMIFGRQDPLSSYPGTFMECPDNVLNPRQECDYCHNHGYLQKQWVIYARCTRNDANFLETFGNQLYDKHHFVHLNCAGAWAQTHETDFNERNITQYREQLPVLPHTRDDMVTGGKCVLGGSAAVWVATALVGGGVVATFGAGVAGVTGVVLLGKAIQTMDWPQRLNYVLNT